MEVTKLDIPIHMEDMLDNRLERELQAINEDPYEINFGVDVKYKTAWKEPQRLWPVELTESFHIGQTTTRILILPVQLVPQTGRSIQVEAQ